MEKDKKPYEAPKLIVHGDVTALTQGGSRSGDLDANYPRGTPSDYGGGLFS